MNLPVYLDNNATTPCDSLVVEAMLPFFTQFYGNAASRTHAKGWEAAAAVDIAREQVATLIGASKEEIIFTSGATESVNLAIKGVAETYAGKGDHIITCVTEHKAVLDTCKELEKKGMAVTYLPVDEKGSIDLAALETAIQTNTILIALMYANNETGVIHPVKEIGAIAKKNGVIFFCDATQAVGKIKVNVKEDSIDLLSLSAHKMYGPKGVGALYIRRREPRVKLVAQMLGGGHEKGIRSGTLNVPGIVGLGKAAELCETKMKEESERLSTLRDKLETGLLKTGDAFVNGDTKNRLPHTTNISFHDADINGLFIRLGKNIALSSGSACTSATPEPSYVLKAMGIDDELAYNSLRFGLSRFTTEEEINYTIKEVSEAVNELRKLKTQHML